MPPAQVREYVGENAAWLMTPVRALVRGVMVLVNLSPRQMAALCTNALIGGIISNSVQTYVYFSKVEKAAHLGLDSASPLYSSADKIILYLSIMSGAFAVALCLVAFNAEWFKLKAQGWEATAGKAGTEMPEETSSAPTYRPHWMGEALDYSTGQDRQFHITVDDPDVGGYL